MTENQFPYPFSKASLCRSDSGFAMVFLLAFLPVALSIALLLPLGIHIFGIHKAELHLCREGLLDSQKIALQTIEKIKLLNLKARLLRVQKKTAQALMLVPKTAPPGLRLYVQTRRAQKILDSQQKLTLNLGRFRLQRQLLQTNHSLKKAGNSSAFFIAATRSMASPNPTIAMRPDDKSDIAPVYVLEDHFSAKQAQQISWITTVTLREDFPWTKEFGWKALKRNQACASTIEEVNGTLQVSLTVAKSWPSF